MRKKVSLSHEFIQNNSKISFLKKVSEILVGLLQEVLVSLGFFEKIKKILISFWESVRSFDWLENLADPGFGGLGSLFISTPEVV